MTDSTLRGRRITVLGAGSVGLETALQAAEQGADVRTGHEQIRDITGLLAGRATAAT